MLLGLIIDVEKVEANFEGIISRFALLIRCPPNTVTRAFNILLL